MKDVAAGCLDIGFKCSLVNRGKFETGHNENQYKDIQDGSDQGTTIHESNIKMFYRWPDHRCNGCRKQKYNFFTTFVL